MYKRQLAAYVEGENAATVLWFALAALAKETAILAPIALFAWEIVGIFARNGPFGKLWLDGCSPQTNHAHARRIASLLIPTLPLGLWYVYHYARTGYVFGNAEFFRYNVAATLSVARFFLALIMRLWQVVGYLHLWALTCLLYTSRCV